MKDVDAVVETAEETAEAASADLVAETAAVSG